MHNDRINLLVTFDKNYNLGSILFPSLWGSL